MNSDHGKIISQQVSIPYQQVEPTIQLLEADATVPFIARYRKEDTGSLDEVQITHIQEYLKQLKEVDQRKQTILKTIREQGNLTQELQSKIEKTWSMRDLEDLYLPYKPKKKTKGIKAKEKGLEPLALHLWKQASEDVRRLAEAYLNEQVPSISEALEGARHVIAEWVNEDQSARQRLRNLFERKAFITSQVLKNKKEKAHKYRDYFDYREKLNKCPAHRLLAIFRGEREALLRLRIGPDAEEALRILNKEVLKGNNEATEQIRLALEDAYKRLLQPSLETEARNQAKKQADEEAIDVFGENLRQLLLAPPLGQKNVLAIDPGYRTGCKLVCLNAQGDFLTNDTIYPFNSEDKKQEALNKLYSLVPQYQIQAIAIGNGTAGRETESWVKSMKWAGDVSIFSVDESGASVYSASEAAREEFPSLDLTVRGAISIGRRLMDPLAELVKIDPKSIGVGQYQHEVNQKRLKERLDQVVMHCVNRVGVHVNMASKHLLTYVSGLGPQLAQNIVLYRSQNGAFNSRNDLKKVPKLGAKAFEQAVGFLRIPDSKNPLDNSGVHPETYGVVEQMAKDLNCNIRDLLEQASLRKQIQLDRYVSGQVGMPTLQDILAELAKPGRDPRETLQEFKFAEGIESMQDLREGMELPGIVTNITNFGAFVDIGIKENGLVHISEMADRFIKDPSQVLKLHQPVKVKVIGLDLQRGRIQLSMKQIYN